MSSLLLTSPADGVALVTLNRPDRMNALDDELLVEALPAVFDELAADESVRAVVITGAGRGFCAGADLDCTGFSQPSAVEAEDFMRASHRTPLRIRSLPQPTIAAVNGAAIGAGFGLALACDQRFASPKAKLGSPFVRMGLVPDYGVTYFLPRLIGETAALDLLLTSRLVSGAEALEMGVVSRISEDVVGDAVAWAESIAAMPPAAVRATRRNVRRSLELSAEAEILEQEVRSQSVALFGTEFAHEFAAYKAGIGGSGST